MDYINIKISDNDVNKIMFKIEIMMMKEKKI